MSNKNAQKHYIDTVATLLIFAIFAVCIIVAILAGANVYKGITARDSESYEMRTCKQYIANKVRMAESPESVSVVPIESCSALRIDETEGDDRFSTYVYCHDGWLREIYLSADDSPVASSGEKLLEIDSLSFDLDSGLVSADIGKDGSHEILYLSVRGGEDMP